MKYEGFIGPTYTGQSPTPATDRTINMFPERIQSASPENQIVLQRCPGLNVYAQAPGGPIKALYTDPVTGAVIVVYGYIGGNDAVSIVPGPGSGAVMTPVIISAAPYYTFASNASSTTGQVMMAASNGSGYILSGLGGPPATFTLTPITSGFLTTSMCAMIDGFFLSLIPNSQKFQVSALNDGTTWVGSQFTLVSQGPENIISMIANHGELWLFGSQHGEVYVNAGLSPFPFARLTGIMIETGIIAPRSLVKIDNTIMWLGQDERGAGVVWKAQGYTPVRVSNHAVEYFIGQYMKYGGISTAVAYSYQDSGHTFYVISFPAATSESSAQGGTTQDVIDGATWVYDVSTGMWHERMNLNLGQSRAFLGRNHAFGYGMHLVGDWQSSNIYEMHSNYYSDAGQPQKLIRRAPHIVDEQKRIFYSALTVEQQVGAGPYPTDGNGIEPQAVLRYSNDGGVTWSNELEMPIGFDGEYATRVRWTMLGSARRRAFEWSTTESVPVCLVEAYLEVEEEAA